MLSFDSAHLAALAGVIRTGSFEAAAASIGVTPSAVSQRIRLLEERLGTVLIRRGQPCTGTETGMRLFRHAEEVALLEHDLAAEIGGSGAEGPLPVRIAVNADSLATWFLPALAAAQQSGSGFLFDLTLDDQDHSAGWLRRGAVTAAVTAHSGAVQGCDSFPLGSLRYIASASPDYMAAHFPDGVTGAALAGAPALTFNRKDRLQERWLRLRLRGAECPAALPTHFLPASRAFTDAALLGLGWGLNPEALVRGHLEAGRLVALDPELPLDTPLFWQISRVAASPLSALTRAVRAAACEWLVAPEVSG